MILQNAICRASPTYDEVPACFSHLNVKPLHLPQFSAPSAAVRTLHPRLPASRDVVRGGRRVASWRDGGFASTCREAQHPVGRPGHAKTPEHPCFTWKGTTHCSLLNELVLVLFRRPEWATALRKWVGCVLLENGTGREQCCFVLIW